MDDLFRLDGASNRDPRIEQWLDGQAQPLQAIARRWLSELRSLGEGDIRELMHDGFPTVCVDDVALAYVGVFQRHVNIGFFRGAELSDPAGLLDGRGRMMRHIKLRPASQVDEQAVGALIGQAYVQVKTALTPWRPRE